MKLKNKLIPIFATAATAGVVVPMTLTSCGNNITMIDTTNFTPDYEQCAVEKLDDANAATTEYMGFIKKNPSYFAQELAYGTAVVWNNLFPKKSGDNQVFWVNPEKTSIKVGSSTPKFGSTLIVYPGMDEIPYPTISVDIKIKLEFEISFLFRFSETKQELYTIHYTVDTNASFNNMLFFVNEKGVGRLQPPRSHYENKGQLNTWSVTFLDRGVNSAYSFCYDNWSLNYNTRINKEITHRTSIEEYETTTSSNVIRGQINSPDKLEYVKFLVEQGSDWAASLINKTYTGNPEEDAKIANELDMKTYPQWVGEYEADTGFSDSLFIAAATGILNFPSYYLGMTTTARHIDTLDVPLSYRYGEEQADSGDNNVYLGGWFLYEHIPNLVNEDDAYVTSVYIDKTKETEDILIPEVDPIDPNNQRFLLIDNEAVLANDIVMNTQETALVFPAKIVDKDGNAKPFTATEWENNPGATFKFTKRTLNVKFAMSQGNPLDYKIVIDIASVNINFMNPIDIGGK